jgi:hypothetical protein
MFNFSGRVGIFNLQIHATNSSSSLVNFMPSQPGNVPWTSKTGIPWADAAARQADVTAGKFPSIGHRQPETLGQLADFRHNSRPLGSDMLPNQK